MCRVKCTGLKQRDGYSVGTQSYVRDVKMRGVLGYWATNGRLLGSTMTLARALSK